MGNGLSVEVHGIPGSEEYEAAIWLRNLIYRSTLPGDTGKIAIHVSVRFPGQKYREVDLVLRGFFPNGLVRDLQLSRTAETTRVRFFDIFTVIEVKGHTQPQVRFAGANADVFYDPVWKSATEQSDGQAYSAKNFIEDGLGWTPWVCNLLLFSNMHNKEFPAIPNNFLAGNSTFEDFLTKLCISRKLTRAGRSSSEIQFDCFNEPDSERRQNRFKELTTLLGNQNYASTPPPQRPRAQNSSGRYYRYNSIPRKMAASYARAKWRLLKVGAVILAVWAVIMGVASLLHSGNSSINPTTTAISLPLKLATCANPTCGCSPRASFRNGAAVYIEFAGKDSTPVSAVIRDPVGKYSTLLLRPSKPNRHGDMCFIAKHPLDSSAPRGPYAVQITAKNGNGSESVLSRGFTVSR